MRMNLPVTHQELDYPADHMLVSVTDTKGFIIHTNRAFVAVSGYSYDELIGQSHNLVRHPDMPAVCFKDLWRTIGHGNPWTGLVKNRTKCGDHYWVVANVTPILENGKPVAYMSVRTKPSRAQIDATEALYKQINAATDAGKLPFTLEGGVVYRKGVRRWKARLHNLSLTTGLGIAIALMVAVGMSPLLLHLDGPTEWLAQLGALALGGVMVMAWFHRHFTGAIHEAQRFANDLAGCNLTSSIASNFPPPMGPLIRSLHQIVVGDVRGEIANFTQSASEIAAGGNDLSARTESQASSLEETAASMEELSSTVKHTADTAQQVSIQGTKSTEVAMRGGEAVNRLGESMRAIDASSARMQEIIGVIEGIAFQTNILALNAAVEAARAGDQGRGFAVVAKEVRALAQRSAVAAKEIRELIAHSAQQISQGTQQMKSAASTIDEVVQSVKQVGELIQVITNATKEQALGISQVNEAVNQLDSVTQKNAALVEESAASAEGLNTSGVMLQRAAQVFHLP
jgi:aerotaxis receptor